MFFQKNYFFLSLGIFATREPDKNGGELLRPNIIFVLADDLGWSDVTWNNHKVRTTPFMSEMVKNGTMLTQSYLEL